MKMKLIALLLIALTGCASNPGKPPMQTADVADCRAVEGAGIRYTKKGQIAHKYICNGKAVWAISL